MDERKELLEAISAADNALRCLRAAGDCLRSAGNWGIVDLLGGGILSTFMKHSKMNSAEQQLSNARSALRRFANEVRDVDEALDVNIRADDFLSFADYFFDGVIADWMMQKRIGDAKAQVEEAIGKVSRLRARLQALLDERA